ncbi:formate hydrogenlyase subunit 6/NADH:ubiquinone oxidoreductase subunit I [Desulfobaculum xiamenense]|uniref:Formate hydrogenlyase subunit 6/NADH:ubiquinone oxidoreductase subunit I n=1 Tax=Desulfobaculum xiamenense TaxID=995050 RepID=A0A846QHL0_9BACT|nr:4Fe-4S dicluster domain-containing protein [Desulfobaculum xiamenense]NJB66507.1 formate hydrogenlyase subunit 6/NADH:ubiquinone oxidoreductase subunit I [Desulfobaculum xiamenense]
MLTFLKVLWRNLLQGPSTDPFPFGETHTPKRLRGKVRVDSKACAGCSMCINVCAGGAIRQVEREDGSGKDFYVWHNTCTFCGLCERFCPTGAIKLSNDWSTAHLNSEKFTFREHEFITYDKCEKCSTRMPRVPLAMLKKIYGEPTEDIMKLYRLCPECRRQRAARQLGA